MKTRNYLSVISWCLFVIVLGAGCSSDYSPAEVSHPNADVPVPISVQGASIGVELSTRAASAITSGSMGVYLGSANDYTPKYNAQYTCSGGKWSSSSPINVVGKAATLYAYYPYNSGLGTSVGNPPISLSAQPYSADKEFCFAHSPVETSVKNTSPSVSFKMNHAYARLQFVITRNNSGNDAYDSGPCKVSRIELAPASGSIFTSGRLDITKSLSIGTSSPNPSLSGGVSKYTITTSGSLATSGISAGGTDSSLDYLFPPQQFSSALNLTVVVDGYTLTAAIPSASLSALSAGVHTQLKINLQSLKIDVSVSTAEIDSDYSSGGDLSGDIEVK